MAMYGQGVTRGKVGFLGISAATNQACAALFPEDQLEPPFLYALLASSYERIRELGHGANQKNLSAEIIRAIEVPIPPDRGEQVDIAAIAASLDAAIQAREREAAALHDAFASLLKVLMNGQLRLRSAHAH
jgi:type I restriction enzyme S subunit